MSTDPRTDSLGNETPADAAHEDDRRTRSRRRLSVLTVAAAVLVAGGGAYWASAAVGDGGGDGRHASTPPPLALDGFSVERAGGPGGDSGVRGTSYRPATPLPDDGPDRAPVHRVTGGPDRQTVRELAEALHVPGTVRKDGRTWRVGGEDGGDTPILRVSTGPSGTWSYTRTGSWDVRVPDLSGRGSDDRRDTAAVAGRKAVSPKRAERAARPVLEAAGVEEAVTDGSAARDGLRFVRLLPEVDGHPAADLPTTLAVDGKGRPVYGQGRLLSFERGAEYPVLTARQTLRELNRRPAPGDMAPCPGQPGKGHERAGDGGGDKDGRAATATVEHRVDQPENSGPHLLPCATTGAPTTAKVTDATFVLATYSSDGKQLLVPSWRFTLDAPTAARDGRTTVTHPAVPARYLRGGKAPEGGTSTRLPSGDPGRIDTGGVEVESYRADARTLTVHFWGGVCADYSARAEESDETVKVVITEKQQEGNCIAMAERRSVKVTLEKPVGDRKVTDEHGTRLPKRSGD